LSSCTTSMTVLQQELFLGKSGNRTMFCISKTSGVDVQRYSMYKEESEVLLPPGRRFKVAGVLDQKELTIIQLEELGNESENLSKPTATSPNPSPSDSQTSSPDKLSVNKDPTTPSTPATRRYLSVETKTWTVNDVSEWLEDLTLTSYIQSFKENAINGKTLLTLKVEDFKELGITNKFHLKTLMLEHENLSPSSPSTGGETTHLVGTLKSDIKPPTSSPQPKQQPQQPPVSVKSSPDAKTKKNWSTTAWTSLKLTGNAYGIVTH